MGQESKPKVKPVSRLAPFVSLFFIGAAFSAAQSTSSAPDPGIVTDRPDITESSIVVPRGSLQFENGFTWTDDHGTTTLDATETLIRLGISTRTELRIVAPNYLGGSPENGTASGFGDTALGFKQQLGPLPGDVGVSVIIALSLPTGSKSVSSHGFDPFIKFPWSKELKRGWSIGGMQSLFWATQQGGRNLIWEPTFYLEKELQKRSPRLPSTQSTFRNWVDSNKLPISELHTRSEPSNRSIFISVSACRVPRLTIS